MKKIFKVVTVCIERDIQIWRMSHKYILEHIEALEYEVIVPDTSVDVFLDSTDSRFNVVSEQNYIPTSKASELKAIIDSKVPGRFGWYLQQFLKIESIRKAHIDREGDEVFLIWDADTVPLRNIRFVNQDGSLNYYFGSEHHKPYFAMLEKITNLSKLVSFSFIAQCLPLYGDWCLGFCEKVEELTGEDWMTAISLLVSGESISEFSEYESLGNWAVSNHLDTMKATQRSFSWKRIGSSLFGIDYAARHPALMASLSKYYDFLSFESWDLDPFLGVNIGSGNVRIERGINNCRMLNLDFENFPGVDLVLDVNDSTWYLPTGRFHHVLLNNILEHIDDVVNVLEKVNLIMASGGILQIEVPFVGSFNHGTDVTNKRGFSFNSFDFLHQSNNYMYRFPERNPFRFQLVKFWRENVIDTNLVREEFDRIPQRLEIACWASKVARQEIPGTFGFVFRKI